MRHALPPVRTVAPEETPVSLAEVKRHLRIDHADEDDKLTAFIEAATGYLDGAEGLLGLALVTQTWRHRFAGWCEGRLRLALPMATSPVVTYLDPAGDSQTLAADQYELVEDSLGSVIVATSGAVWPALQLVASPVSVTASHGFGAAEVVPAPIKTAMLMMIGDWYENRQPVVVGASVGEVPLSVPVAALLKQYSRAGIIA